MKHIFIVNPAAGAKNATETIRSILEQRKEPLDFEIYVTKEPGDGTLYIKNRLKTCQEKIRFYACGGDGTLNEVVNGVCGYENASVACYPCGSGNDYVKYYGGKDRFMDLDALIDAPEHKVDLMRIGDKCGINVTNFGFDIAVLSTMVKLKRKKFFKGKRAYIGGVIAAFFRSMKNQATVYVDGKAINESTFLLCTVANGKYVGGSFQCAPKSQNDDGLLEVCLVKPVSRFTFIRLVGTYAKGKHLDNPKFKKYLVYERGKSVQIKAPPGFAFSIDGEIFYQNDFSIDIMFQALNFAVPELS